MVAWYFVEGKGLMSMVGQLLAVLKYITQAPNFLSASLLFCFISKYSGGCGGGVGLKGQSHEICCTQYFFTNQLILVPSEMYLGCFHFFAFS